MEHALKGPLKKEPRLQAYSERLFDERNVGMVRKIEEYLAIGETHFVIAGSGHLTGKGGILNLMRSNREKPCKIEQLTALGKPKKKTSTIGR